MTESTLYSHYLRRGRKYGPAALLDVAEFINVSEVLGYIYRIPSQSIGGETNLRLVWPPLPIELTRVNGIIGEATGLGQHGSYWYNIMCAHMREVIRQRGTEIIDSTQITLVTGEPELEINHDAVYDMWRQYYDKSPLILPRCIAAVDVLTICTDVLYKVRFVEDHGKIEKVLLLDNGKFSEALTERPGDRATERDLGYLQFATIQGDPAAPTYVPHENSDLGAPGGSA